ncbi:MAG: DUF1801 domain-containing protein [Demequinaceae bacterium]|nr:DUF1801 domain-containing protein [Demequinaceae bacterium]
MSGSSDGTFSAAEKAAIKEAAAESKRAKAALGKEAEAQACLDKIAAMAPADRALAERVHEIITTIAPDLDVKTWYGMPAYAKDGKTVVFFQDAGKFKARYATLGFQDNAALDDGTFWPTSFALVSIDDAVAERIAELVKRAVG